MRFDDIICSNAQIRGLERSIYTDKVIQSLIFEGQPGTGKKTIANIYINALMCISEKEKPCGVCSGCRLFSSGNHPDIFEIDKGRKKSVGVEEIKNLVRQAVIRPNESNRKVFLIHDAHLMTAQAQNALLKLIEEPPKYLSIILLCENIRPLLETIISRCTIIPMPYLSVNSIISALSKKGISGTSAEIAAQSANGSMGKAEAIATDAEYLKRRDELLEILLTAQNSKTEAYSRATEKKDKLSDMIMHWQSFIRDAILFKGGEIDNIENVDKIIKIEKYADKFSRDELISQLEAVCDAEKRMYYNAQSTMILDNLMAVI